MIEPEQALKGRSKVMDVSGVHRVTGNSMRISPASDMSSIVVGMGCFWGAERLFWNIPGVYSTAVGYAGGYTENPLYEEVCSGMTGHTEVVLVIYDASKVSLETLLTCFFENHDPTQGMRQGNDMGTQYRSAIYTSNELDKQLAVSMKEQFELALSRRGFGSITTEIDLLNHFYYAEEYHQQYLAKNPNGYCGLAGTGVCFSQ
ncbi:peptide-methionine (S)-S-oxide reductase MsrA [Litoribacillus peritrichatus]|uniref:Peptide methionine sulfoxide reductase MsrA n=1 Tax=Litoribacillus peritrichatus TaxID=718191 RepID=A0ABP7M2Q6_9GAMM